MSGAPLVTVVVPTHNRRRCLARALDSVLNQEYGPVELIVVDDASTDGTSEWMADAYPRVRLIRNPVNRGVSASRNAGVAAGRGRFIAFLDDDDWWDPAFLRRQMDLLASRPDAVLSYCDFTSVAEDGGSPAAGISGEMGDDPVKTFLMGSPIPSATLVVVRREAFEKERGFREDYRMCEDRELYLRLVRHGAFVHEPRPLAFKTRSADSVTRNLPLWEACAQTLLADFFSREDSRPYRHLRDKSLARWQTRFALMCIRRAGTRLLGMRLAASALSIDALGATLYAADRVISRAEPAARLRRAPCD